MKKNQFKKLSRKRQVELLRGTKSECMFTFERANIDEEQRTVWMSVSSEEPYSRWWGEEVLSHSNDAIRTERFKNGAPLLVDHDTRDHVGIIEDFEVTEDKKMRIKARFGTGQRAQEIYQDVLDGIRKNTSIGYMINDLVLEKQEGDTATYRVTDWEPFEASLVSVPADYSVGVGRSHDIDDIDFEGEDMKTKGNDSTTESTQPKEGAAVETKTVPVESSKAPNADAQRQAQVTKDILALGDLFPNDGGPELARQFATDPTKTVADFNEAMRSKLEVSRAPYATAQVPAVNPATANRIEVISKQGRLRSFRDLPLADGSTMKAEHAAYRAGMWILGNIYKNERGLQYCREHGVGASFRTMGGGALDTGGALIPVELEQAIIDLRDEYGVARKLARLRPMSSSTKDIPSREGGVSAYFVNDESGTGPTASDKSWGNVHLDAKLLMALTKFAMSMEEDSVIDVADDLAQEMAYAFAEKEDDCWINGDGSSTYGGIEGLITKFEATAYTSRITLASGNDTFPEVTATDLAQVMAGPAAYGKPGAIWLTSETGASLMFDRLMAAGGGNTITDLAGSVMRRYLGYEVITSEKMPAGAATDYSNKIMSFFGRFDMGCSFGSRRGITIQVLREKYADVGQIGIVGSERFDVVNHHLGSTTAKGPIAGAYGN